MLMSEILISTDKSKLDLDLIHNFLTQSYWAKGRTKETVKTAIDHALCFGVYKNNAQIGFARVVTDTVIFAYIMDVFMLESARGSGYGKQLLEAILAHRDVCRVDKCFLATEDAQDFYRQFGFVEAASNLYMERLTTPQ